jgi:hypothetical protein
MVVHTCNPSTQKDSSLRPAWAKASLGYIVRPCLQNKKKKKMKREGKREKKKKKRKRGKEEKREGEREKRRKKGGRKTVYSRN